MTVRDQELGFAGEKNFYNLIFLFNTKIPGCKNKVLLLAYLVV
jgi:hypothetical protein